MNEFRADPRSATRRALQRVVHGGQFTCVVGVARGLEPVARLIVQLNRPRVNPCERTPQAARGGDGPLP